VFRRRVGQQRVKFLAQRMSWLEAAVGGEVVLEEPVERAGNMAADAIQRLVLAAIAIVRARVDHDAFFRAEIALDGLRAALKSPVFCAGASCVSGWPAASQACSPPSSSATASCPSQRSSHHARAAYMPPCASYATTC
jgi:hypothetical protein